MKRLHQFAVIAAVITTVSIRFAQAAPTRGPVISPSVKAAARLKYSPPRNWIRHYLGDDRYKIAGGIWKVVTTPNDKFYYPAYAAEMLRRSPNNVIGFSSTDEAIEAGYTAHPNYFSIYNVNNSSVHSIFAQDLQPGQNNLARENRSASPTNVLSPSSKARRILLSDQLSSAILPRGWSYAKSAPQPVYGTTSPVNVFLSPDKKSFVIFVTGTSEELTSAVSNVTNLSLQLRNTMNKRNSSGRVNTRLNGEVSSLLDTTTARLGGLPAMTALTKDFPGNVSLTNALVTVAAKGTKFYMAITPIPRQSSLIGQVLNSFRAR